jgi:hypothetical protein
MPPRTLVVTQALQVEVAAVVMRATAVRETPV